MSAAPTPAELDELMALANAATRLDEYPGYAVTQDGQVWSMDSNWRGYGPRPLRPVLNRDGYQLVRLQVGGRRVHPSVHKLVASAFLGPQPAGTQIRHYDGDKTNNAASNLRWGSAKDNADDRERHGRAPQGERNGFSRLTEVEVREIRRLRSTGLLHREIAERFGINKSTIARINRREAWAHVA